MALFVVMTTTVNGLVNTLNLNNDERSIFLVDSFGFGSSGGVYKIETMKLSHSGSGAIGFVTTVSKTLFKDYLPFDDACDLINGKTNSTKSVSLVAKLPFKGG